jgi:tRNA(adenine34) deaminase
MPMMEECLALAQKAADENEVPVGAVIVQDGKIVGRGYNRRETEQNPISHAEIERCVLYVTLEPCPMCLAACQQARVERVVYGAKDPKGGALSLGYKLNEDARTNHRFAVDFEETPACGKILSEFFSKKRNRIAP